MRGTRIFLLSGSDRYAAGPRPGGLLPRPGPLPAVPRSASPWGTGTMPIFASSGCKSGCNRANAKPPSDCTPVAASTPNPSPAALALAASSTEVFPMPAGPRTSRPPPRSPARSSTSATTRSSRSRPNKIGAIMSLRVPCAAATEAGCPAGDVSRSPRQPSHRRRGQQAGRSNSPGQSSRAGQAHPSPTAPHMPSRTTEAPARGPPAASAPVPGSTPQLRPAVVRRPGGRRHERNAHVQENVSAMNKVSRAKNGSPRPENHVIVLFGATGDLARRKLLPGLLHLHAAGLLPREYRIIGSPPHSSALTHEQFRQRADQACEDFCITKPTDPAWPSFAERLSFGAAEPGNTADLEAAIQRAEKEIGGPPRRPFHLAVPPAAFALVIEMLGAAGLVNSDTRGVIEKPFRTTP